MKNSDVIKELLKTKATWDMYSLSIIYLKLIYTLKNKFQKSSLILNNKIPMFPSLFTNEDLSNYINYDFKPFSNYIGKNNSHKPAVLLTTLFAESNDIGQFL